MGFFNYFIKCIIRNITYRLCKPKVFLTVLLCCFILFGLHTKGYCAFEASDLEIIMGGFQSITNNQGTIISQLSSMGINVSDIENSLNSVKNELTNISSYTNLTNAYLFDLISKVENINTTLITLCQQQNIYYENVTSELKDIKNLLSGGETETTGVTLINPGYADIIPNLTGSGEYKLSSGSIDVGYYSLNYNFEKGYVYDILCSTSHNNLSTGLFGTIDNVSVDGSSFYLRFLYNGQISISSFTYNPTKNGVLTFIANNPAALDGTTWTITKKSSSSLSGINSTISQGNQLQQEQNQLQQEQNDFLQQGTSDNDVSVDSFNSVDANDITSSGLTGVFTNIYNSITSWSSKDINLPIPHTNKNITIPANYTQNMLSSFGGGWIITFISSIYYFIVARFIIYTITSIINSIKSGSILETDSKNNITTDML